MAWSDKFRHAVIDQLFVDTDGVNALHDVVFAALGESYTNSRLRLLALQLPRDLLCTALQWSMSDTVFRDGVYDVIISDDCADQLFDVFN